MSQNCNKIAQLSEAQFDSKAAAAKVATGAILQAMSECFKAAEIIHSGQAIERAAAYLRSATTRIDVADAALLRNQEILETAPVQPDALEWLRGLDYIRLYNDGVRDRAIPASEAQWSALVEINRVQGYMGVADGFRNRFAEFKKVIQVLVENLSNTSESETDATEMSLISLLTELNGIAAFAQMVAYINRLKPMDPHWSSHTMGVAASRA